MCKELYRYIGLEDFINLVINNKDRFVRPVSWDDRYEGYIFSYMKTREEVRRIVETMYYDLCLKNYNAVINNYFKLWHSKWYTYAQCWSKHSETDAMWRCYAYGNRAIRIRTKEDKLLSHAKKIFPEDKNFNVFFKEVKYDLNNEMAYEQQIKQIKKSSFTYEPYFHKRNVFEHEGEYRLLIVDNNLLGREGFSAFAAQFKIEENIKDKSNEEIIDYVTERIYDIRVNFSNDKENNVRIEDAGDISEFLGGVMVHPLAEKWYVDIISDICKEKNIKFDGQSKIYELI